MGAVVDLVIPGKHATADLVTLRTKKRKKLAGLERKSFRKILRSLLLTQIEKQSILSDISQRIAAPVVLKFDHHKEADENEETDRRANKHERQRPQVFGDRNRIGEVQNQSERACSSRGKGRSKDLALNSSKKSTHQEPKRRS